MDIETLVFSMLISMSGGSFCLLCFAFLYPSYKELRYWSASLLLLAVAALTILLRQDSSSGVLIVAGNATILVSFFIAFIGIQIYFKRDNFYLPTIITSSIIFIVLFIWLTFVNDSLAGRIAVASISISFSIALGLLGLTLIKSATRLNTTCLWFGIAICSLSTVFIISLAGLASIEHGTYNFYNASTYNNLMFGSAILSGVIFPIGYISMWNEKLIRKIRHNANIDPLTQLLNRRYFYKKVNDYYQRSAYTEQPVSMLIIDLDYLKSINDIHGHQSGDLVLKALAEVLRKNILNNSIAARFGGDEFVIFMPDTSLRKAATFAEIINDNFSTKVRDFNYANPSPSLSIGVATAAASEKTVNFLKHADKNLYKAKKKGRNQIVASAISQI
ncbi:MAG: diguanylate cyclase (GGDEF)-like protein [Chitinophagales bacterium]